jgi:hypothetical protein
MKMLQVAKGNFVDPSSITSIRSTAGLFLGEGILHYVQVSYGKEKEINVFFNTKEEADNYALTLNNRLENIINEK